MNRFEEHILESEKGAREYFEKKRWKYFKYCPSCCSDNIRECKDHIPMPYRCRDCRKHFSVRTGTVLAHSNIPLHKWLRAMELMARIRRPLTTNQMAEELGIALSSAQFLEKRIRKAWESAQSAS